MHSFWFLRLYFLFFWLEGDYSNYDWDYDYGGSSFVSYWGYLDYFYSDNRNEYPVADSGYLPPGIFFVYAYNEDNNGIVRIENSRFEYNDGFPIISCGAYSYCHVVMKNCIFKDNILEYDGYTYYNAIFMQDNSYGKIIISDSKFIGNYQNQSYDYSLNWLYDSDANSTFTCNNCTFLTETNTPTTIPTTQPTTTPTIPTYDPTTVPSSMPTDIPSDSPSHIPSGMPSQIPSIVPSQNPSQNPSENPTQNPTQNPSTNPSNIPSYIPSSIPRYIPSNSPSIPPTNIPSRVPTATPTSENDGNGNNNNDDDDSSSTTDGILVVVCLLLLGVVAWASYYFVCSNKHAQKQVEQDNNNNNENEQQTVEVTTHAVQVKQGKQDMVKDSSMPEGTQNATLGVKPSLSVSADKPKAKGNDTVGLLDEAWSQEQ